ncbi:MAG: hypothetical protein JWN95_440 [Frankiales bacterium]|nr:hypothetical protein [Frankiales bacterium]
MSGGGGGDFANTHLGRFSTMRHSIRSMFARLRYGR